MSSTERDVFLSHAVEDKERFVRPFAEELAKRGITYWLDEAEISWGDRITVKINDGLARARFVIVFLSHSFLGKNWSESELGAALNKETTEGITVVLPLILDDPKSVLERYPLLRDKAYLKWAEPISVIADQVEAVVGGKPVTSTVKETTRRRELIIADLFYEGVSLLYQDNRYATHASKVRSFLLELGRSYRYRTVSIDLLRHAAPRSLHRPLRQLVKSYRHQSKLIYEALKAEPPSDNSLQIVSIGGHEAEFDVMLRNTSNETVYITRITLRVLKDRGYVMPILDPSAKYSIPVGHLNWGEANSLDVSHIIEPHGADRFRIAPQTTRVLYLRLTLEYNKNYSVSENAWLWI
jgi:hypothetical protein